MSKMEVYAGRLSAGAKGAVSDGKIQKVCQIQQRFYTAYFWIV